MYKWEANSIFWLTWTGVRIVATNWYSKSCGHWHSCSKCKPNKHPAGACEAHITYYDSFGSILVKVGRCHLTFPWLLDCVILSSFSEALLIKLVDRLFSPSFTRNKTLSPFNPILPNRNPFKRKQFLPAKTRGIHACKSWFKYSKICWNKSEISQCNITPLDHSTQRGNQDSHWVCPFFSTTPKGILVYKWIHSSTEKILANFLFLPWKNLCKDSCHQREWESLPGHSFPPEFVEGFLQWGSSSRGSQSSLQLREN